MDKTALLVREAKNGDSDALSELIARFYQIWLRKYHGRIGAAVGRGYETVDLVHSALANAIEELPTLRNEAAFFAWVTAIMRHKLAKRREQLANEQPLEGSASSIDQPEDGIGGWSGKDIDELDEYLHTVEAIEELSSKCPDEMTTVRLKYLDGLSVSEIEQRLGRPQRTIYRWLRDGTARLQRNLR